MVIILLLHIKELEEVEEVEQVVLVHKEQINQEDILNQVEQEEMVQQTVFQVVQ